MNRVLRILWNDLKRDAKRPWFMLLLAALPLGLSALIAAVFGGRGGSGPMPTVHVAVLDQDKDFLSGVLRSLPAQGDAAQRLRLHFVETEQEGLRLVERDKVSALIVLPSQMTAHLLAHETNTIILYENPAQQVLPKVVRHGISLLALGLSAAAEALGEPLREIRELIQTREFPDHTLVGQAASASVQQLGGFRKYLFPPLVQLETLKADDFQPMTNSAPAPLPGP